VLKFEFKNRNVVKMHPKVSTRCDCRRDFVIAFSFHFETMVKSDGIDKFPAESLKAGCAIRVWTFLI
ncbi:hypothetical protein Bhyg_11006, partial [Pseudolycoriella hygida]